MRKNTVIALGAAVLLSAGPAHALTLTNLDGEQRLQITEGFDEPLIQDIVIAAGQTLEGLCGGGCTITLENGDEASFEGYEVVVLEDGRLTVAE